MKYSLLLLVLFLTPFVMADSATSAFVEAGDATTIITNTIGFRYGSIDKLANPPQGTQGDSGGAGAGGDVQAAIGDLDYSVVLSLNKNSFRPGERIVSSLKFTTTVQRPENLTVEYFFTNEELVYSAGVDSFPISTTVRNATFTLPDDMKEGDWLLRAVTTVPNQDPKVAETSFRIALPFFIILLILVIIASTIYFVYTHRRKKKEEE